MNAFAATYGVGRRFSTLSARAVPSGQGQTGERNPLLRSRSPLDSGELAGAAGFEPATYGFGDRRSTS